MDKAGGGDTGQTAAEEVVEEELRIWFVFVLNLKESAVEIFCGEVDSLSGEVSDNVDTVSTPEWNDSFLAHAASEAVDDSVVLRFELGILVLGLEEQLDSFNGGGEGLGDDAGESTCEEVEEVEIVSLWGGRGSGLLGGHILG